MRTDVTVVGGGMVGSTLALALASRGVSVALVDAGHSHAAGHPARPIALALASQRALAKLGAWATLAGAAHPIERVHVSQESAFGVSQLDAASLGVPALGYVAPSGAIEAALERCLSKTADGLQRMTPARVMGIEAGELAVVVRVAQPSNALGVTEAQPTLGNATEIHTQLVVLADGQSSALRTDLGVRERKYDYGQSALVAQVEIGQDHRNTAFERFTAGGPLALLPFGRRRFAIVWSALPARIACLSCCTESRFLEALNTATGGRFDGVRCVQDRVSFELHGSRVEQLVGERLVLIGNAAQTLHPVAGQGLNLGMRDVAVLADLCAEAVSRGDDPGASELLQRYRRERRWDRSGTAFFTDFLAYAFGSSLGPLRAVRAAGLIGLELLPFAKQRFATRAMGFVPPVPRSMRRSKL